MPEGLDLQYGTVERMTIVDAWGYCYEMEYLD